MEGLALRVRSEISGDERRWKVEKVGRKDACWKSGGVLREGLKLSCWWILWILSLKNSIRGLQKAAKYKWESRESGSLIILLSSENKDLVLPSLEQMMIEQ